MHMQPIYTPPSNHLLISSGLLVVKVKMANVFSIIANTCLNGGRNAIHSLNISVLAGGRKFLSCNAIPPTIWFTCDLSGIDGMRVPFMC